MESRPNVVVINPGYMQGLFVFSIGVLAGWLMTRPETSTSTAGVSDSSASKGLKSQFSDLLRSSQFKVSSVHEVSAQVDNGIAAEQLYAWQQQISGANQLAASKAHTQGDKPKEDSILESDIAINRYFWAKALQLVQSDVGTVNQLAGNLKTAAEAIPQATKDLTKWQSYFGALNSVTDFFVPKK